MATLTLSSKIFFKSLINRGTVCNRFLFSFLCGHFPQTLNIKDRMGRTAYHYAAMCNDGGQYYQLVGSYGPDATISDSVSKI